jgi:hypothetical protein
MSQSGALIEAAVIPDPGAAVILKRGSLQIAGQVAWKVDGNGGIAFSAKVSVAEWLARKVRNHQERVDEIVLSLRSDRQLTVAADPVSIPGVTSIVTELMALRANLAQLENGLATDAILVATHPEIQTIDIALQRVDRVLGQLRNTAL